MNSLIFKLVKDSYYRHTSKTFRRLSKTSLVATRKLIHGLYQSKPTNRFWAIVTDTTSSSVGEASSGLVGALNHPLSLSEDIQRACYEQRQNLHSGREHEQC
jgi:hypothetical protein